MERTERDGLDQATRAADAERADVRDDVEARLRRSGVTLTGDESDDQLASMSEAVERFDDAVIAIGGDRMVDSADSSEPAHRELVIPARRADESPDAYIARVQEATARVASRGDASGEA